MPVLSPELTELLDCDGTLEDVARLIATAPALRAEAEASLPALEHVAKAKAGREGVKAVVGRRFALYPQPQRSDAEWAAWWSDYFDVLEDVALASLESAMRAHVADPASEFMPKPGKLKELAFTCPTRAMGRFIRARAALAWKEPSEIFKATPQDIEAVRRMAEETAARLTPPKEQKPGLPSIAGKTDDAGITPELRAILNRQRGER